MKTFKQILSEAEKRTVEYSKLSSEQIDKLHSQLTPEEQSKFSDLVNPDASIPVLVQQRKAIEQIHRERIK